MAGRLAAQKRANRKWIFFVLVVAIALSVMAVCEGVRLKQQNAKNLEEQVYLKELIAQEQERSEELKLYSERIHTEEFAEWYAKERMGLIHKNEIIIRGE